jgi:ankyrin repeat protein
MTTMANNKLDIIEAASSSDLTKLREALKNPNKNINEKDQEGRTALIHAAINGKAEIVSLLLENGADPNIADLANGHTALHSAVQGWHEEVVRKLLKAGAKVDAVDNFGNTPLWRAVFVSRGKGEIIKALLGSGADKNLVNAKGTSPIILAKRIANFNVAQFFT